MPCKFAPLVGGFCAEPKSGEPRLRHDGTETLGHGWFEILLTVRVSCVCAGTLSVLWFAVVVFFFFSVFEVSLLFLRMRRSRAWPLPLKSSSCLSSLFVLGIWCVSQYSYRDAVGTSRPGLPRGLDKVPSNGCSHQARSSSKSSKPPSVFFWCDLPSSLFTSLPRKSPSPVQLQKKSMPSD